MPSINNNNIHWKGSACILRAQFDRKGVPVPVSIIIIKYCFPAFWLGFTDSPAYFDQHSEFQDIFVCSWIKTSLTVCSGESDLSRVFSLGLSFVVLSKWAFVCVRKIAQWFHCRNRLKVKELLRFIIFIIYGFFSFPVWFTELTKIWILSCVDSLLCPWASPLLTAGLPCLVRLWTHQTMGCALCLSKGFNRLLSQDFWASPEQRTVCAFSNNLLRLLNWKKDAEPRWGKQHWNGWWKHFSTGGTSWNSEHIQGLASLKETRSLALG